MYSGEPLPHARVPRKLSRTFHAPVPLDKDFLYSLEHSYPEWFAFVRSHKRRYCCCDDDIAQKRSENCIDEDVTAVWANELLRQGRGERDPTQTDPFCEL